MSTAHSRTTVLTESRQGSLPSMETMLILVYIGSRGTGGHK